MALLFLFLKVKGTDNANRRLPLKQKFHHMDPVGCLVFIAAICCLLLALQWGGQSKPWRSATVIGLFIGFGLLSCAFGHIQWRLGDRATIPLRVLRQRSMCVGALVLFFLGASTYVVRLPFRHVLAMTTKLRRTVFISPFGSKSYKVSMR